MLRLLTAGASVVIATAQVGTIHLLAGMGGANFNGGDNLAATSSNVNYPYGVAADPAGRIYIADTFNNRVRMVDLAGVITTVAGDGDADYYGDGAQATSAALNNPMAVAFDLQGRLLISDTQNHRIRRVEANGIINTIVGTGNPSGGGGGMGGMGGAATAANLNLPRGLAVAPSGRLYFCDSGAHRIKYIDETTGFIEHFAGDGGNVDDGNQATAAGLWTPAGIAVHPSGVVYIADLQNDRVRAVAVNGIISTVVGVGNPTAGTALNNPMSLAIDSAGNVLIADTENDWILSYNPVTSTLSVIAGTGVAGNNGGNGGPATSATLWDPAGIAYHASTGRLIIADTDASVVRYVELTAPTPTPTPTTSNTQTESMGASASGTATGTIVVSSTATPSQTPTASHSFGFSASWTSTGTPRTVTPSVSVSPSVGPPAPLSAPAPAPVGVIVGSVVGATAFLAVAGAGALFFMRRSTGAAAPAGMGPGGKLSSARLSSLSTPSSPGASAPDWASRTLLSPSAAAESVANPVAGLTAAQGPRKVMVAFPPQAPSV